MTSDLDHLNVETLGPTTLIDIIRWRAEHQPDRLGASFLVDGETEEIGITYAEIDRQARAIAATLQSSVAKGERALLFYNPGLEFIAAYLGCLYSGVIAIPLAPPSPSRLRQIMAKVITVTADAGPSVILTTSSTRQMIEDSFAPVPGLRAMQWLITTDVAGEQAEHWRMPSLSSDDPAFLQYTSGSTATPKGVIVSHSNLLSNLKQIHLCFENTVESQGVSWWPPYHDMGLIGGILQPLYAGHPVTLMSHLAFLQRPFRWLQAISRKKATHSGGPNFAYDLCVRRITPEQRDSLDLSHWVLAFNGAERIHPKTLEQFSAYFEPCGFRPESFYPCYGLAEGTLIVAGGSKSDRPVVKDFKSSALGQNRAVNSNGDLNNDTQALVSCGHSVSGQKIVIVDPESLRSLPSGHVGEVWVSGPSVAQGYWNRIAETEHTFKAFLADTGDGPFLRTGDLGFMLDGELFLTGRLKDLIIVAGNNHYPQDIEWTVEHSHPVVKPSYCTAFSVEVDNNEQVVVVLGVEQRYLQKNSRQDNGAGNSRLRSFKIDQVIRAVREAVVESHGLRLHNVVLVSAKDIPKTSSGKLQRYACRAAYLEGRLSVLED